MPLQRSGMGADEDAVAAGTMAAAMRSTGMSLRTLGKGTGFVVALSLALAGCGGGSGSGAGAVEQALAKERLAQDVKCRSLGHGVYDCTFVEEAGVRAMKPQAVCFTFQNHTLARVSCPG